MTTGFYERSKQLKAGLKEANFDVINEVVFNQVMLAMESDEATEAMVHENQQSGECWLGGTTWAGKKVIRVSVSCWQTTESDIERTIELFKSLRDKLTKGD